MRAIEHILSGDGVEMKLCSKCSEWKPLAEFSSQKDKRDGLRAHCKSCHNACNSRWKKAHRSQVRESHKRWRMKNPESVKRTAKKVRMKILADPGRKLCRRISTVICISLKQSKKGQHWESLIGYGIGQLMRHLERQFQPGMTWDNYGQWHIDHKIPLAAFNIRDAESIDFKKAWALKNLQPLWAEDNHRKRNSLDKPFQPSLGF